MRAGIKTKVLLGYIFVIVATTLAIVGVHYATNWQIGKVNKEVTVYATAGNIGAGIFADVLSEEAIIRNFFVTGDRRQLASIKQNRQKIRQSFTALKRLLVNDTEATDIIDSIIDPLLESLIIRGVKLSEGKNTDLKLLVAQFDEDWNQFFKAELKFLNWLNLRHMEAMRKQDLLSKRVYRMTLLLIIIIGILALVAGFIISTRITSHLGLLMKGIRAASKGRYQPLTGVNSDNEIGELIAAFNKMIAIIEANETALSEKNIELSAQEEKLTAQNEEVRAQQEELQQALSTLIKQEDQLNRLYSFSQSLTQIIELNPMIKNSLQGLITEANAQVGAFLLYRKETGDLQVKAAVGLENPDSFPVFQINEGLIGRAAAERKVLVACFDEGRLRTRGLSGEIILAGEIYLPLAFRGALLGLIALGCTDKKMFSTEERNRLAALADQTAVALHNSLLYQEVEESLKKIKEVDQLKSELINTVSHELRTPLASILGFTELLIKKPPESGKFQKFLATIYNESLRLTELINNFLDLQRIESGRLEFSKKVINLENLIRKNVELYRDQSKIHTFEISIEEGLPAVSADPNRVTQILGNLLSNAVKYSPNGGLIEVKASRRRAAEVQVVVSDHGLGIPETAMAKLFEPFFRVDNSDHRQIGGTGLGLAICKKIVSALGGEIWCQSHPGEGSAFIFTLTVAETAGVWELPLKKNTDLNSSYILIVEDDPSMADLVDEALRIAGFNTKRTNDGDKALEIIRAGLPAAVVLDLILPGSLDGWELLKRLKSNSYSDNIPVIITSCLDQKRHGFELGAVEYLIKPFPLEKLVESIRIVTRMASMVVGLRGPGNSPDVGDSVKTLLESKGFMVKGIRKEADLLYVTLEDQKSTDNGGT